MVSLLRRIVEVAILPPAGPFLLIMLGSLLLLTRWRRVGRWTLGLSIAALYFLSTPMCERLMVASVDRHPPLDPSFGVSWPSAEAIVVLGAGVQWGSREWDHDAPSQMAVARLRYAAAVQRRTGVPVLVTGYTGDGMKNVMEHDFSIPVRWIEDRSYDTWENARFTAELLAKEKVPIRRVFLVTHFWHMPRSLVAFRAAGLEPIPAPMGFIGPPPDESWLDLWRPKPSPLGVAKLISREWIGWLWYRWQARTAG